MCRNIIETIINMKTRAYTRIHIDNSWRQRSTYWCECIGVVRLTSYALTGDLEFMRHFRYYRKFVQEVTTATLQTLRNIQWNKTKRPGSSQINNCCRDFACYKFPHSNSAMERRRVDNDRCPVEKRRTSTWRGERESTYFYEARNMFMSRRGTAASWRPVKIHGQDEKRNNYSPIENK